MTILAAAALAGSGPAAADATAARCDIYPVGEDHTDVVIPCTFSQRQGYITIRRDDGVTHDLSPEGEIPGNFRDQHGNRVYRQSGLGDQGQIFRLPDESIYVYWNPERPGKQGDDANWAAPFTTDDFDATTRLRCRAVGESRFGSCPAGVARMDDGQASITIQNPRGEIFTINFMKDYINATNREAEATRQGDTWTVTINGEEVYEVPLAAIEGG
ncbi:MAG: hypothetical protein P8Y54_09440 [Xanthomonadales bacterium]